MGSAFFEAPQPGSKSRTPSALSTGSKKSPWIKRNTAQMTSQSYQFRLSRKPSLAVPGTTTQTAAINPSITSINALRVHDPVFPIADRSQNLLNQSGLLRAKQLSLLRSDFDAYRLPGRVSASRSGLGSPSSLTIPSAAGLNSACRINFLSSSDGTLSLSSKAR